ncbi:MAG: hypothetical protein Q8Q02_16680 [Nocardioides sp.]|nr:hypothetical protein [Nocardioides sp.]
MKRIAIGVASIAMAAGATLATTAPAQAAPLFTGGLVNVAVYDVIDDVNVLNDSQTLNNVSVGAALGVAANICNVGVNVLARQLPGPASCEATASDQVVTIEPVATNRGNRGNRG